MSAPVPVSPLTGPLDTTVRPPGSKSATIRALVIAALANGESRIGHPLEAEDTAAARSALRLLGAQIDDSAVPWRVGGVAGRPSPPMAPLDVGASGLTCRSLIPVAALVTGDTTIEGRERLPERPMGGLIRALQSLGVRVDSRGGRLPVVVHGEGTLPGGRVEVEAHETTQFLTGLLLAAPLATQPMTVVPVGLEGSAGYVAMTLESMRSFGASVEQEAGGYHVINRGYRGSEIDIEPDASAAVYPMVAAAITGGRVVIEGLGEGSLQPDLAVAGILEMMGCQVTLEPHRITVDASGKVLHGVDVDMSGAPDGALAVAVAALFARGETRLRGLASLRLKESDRLEALAVEIGRLGASASIQHTDLVIRPGELSPVTIEAHGDHRIAMAFALVGLMVPGMALSDAAVVNKTWPEYWDVIASW